MDMMRDRTSLGCGLKCQLVFLQVKGETEAYRLNVIANVVDWRGFIFCNVLSLQMRTIGIYSQ
jgi:hypothetical protein